MRISPYKVPKINENLPKNQKMIMKTEENLQQIEEEKISQLSKKNANWNNNKNQKKMRKY